MTKPVRSIFLWLVASSLVAALPGRGQAAADKSAAAASPAGPLTVDMAVKLALERSSSIIGSEASVVDARGGLYRSYSGILPQVQISANRSVSIQEQRRGTQSFNGIVFPTDRQDFRSYANSPGISGSWNFLDLSALSNYQAARNG